MQTKRDLLREAKKLGSDGETSQTPEELADELAEVFRDMCGFIGCGGFGDDQPPDPTPEEKPDTKPDTPG